MAVTAVQYKGVEPTYVAGWGPYLTRYVFMADSEQEANAFCQRNKGWECQSVKTWTDTWALTIAALDEAIALHRM